MIRHCALLCCAILALVGTMTSAELPEVYREDFNAQNPAWTTGGWQYGSATINGGVYRIVRSFRGGWWYLPAPLVYLDLKADYDIEVRLKWNAGQATSLLGLVYATADIGNANILGYTPGGNLAAYRYEQESQQEVIPSAPVQALKQGTEWNILTIRRRGSAVAVVVNDEVVTYTEEPRVYGRTIGIAVAGACGLDVDYLVVRQQQEPIRLAKDYPKNVQRENLGPLVNSSAGDLSPVISADGRKLYIGRYPYRRNIGNPEAEDIYVSNLQPDGTWGQMMNVGPPLNNWGSNFLISITPDGNTAIVGNTYYPDGRPRGAGISVTSRTENGWWTVPTQVHIDRYYNRNRFSEMCLDPSGQHLIMAAQRDDSFGDKDLYVSTRKPDGTFSEPLHIPALSTWGNEMSPFVAADGQTLYFATDGLRGYGGMDVWMSRRLDDTWQNWSQPENLGPSINTDKWDAYFTVPADGKYAYMSASNDTDGSADIYRIQLTAGVAPRPTVLVSGRVLDATTKKPIATVVQYESLTKNVSVGEAHSVLPEGSYAIALAAGDLYGFRAEAKGYYPISDQLDTRELQQFNEIHRDLYLVPLRANEIIRLANVFFDFSKSELRPESQTELNRLVELLRQNTTMTIELHGHTDDVGGSADNKRLSTKRVEAVKRYLESMGVDPKRLKAIGHGESKPLAPNSTEEGRQQNRRVEFKIVRL